MKKINKEREYRMYGLVIYQLSGIQKGIQFGHAVVEYGNDFSEDLDYLQWSAIDKTFIILNGGTTNKQTSLETGLPYGTLNQHLLTLVENNISVTAFYELDLGNQLTAISFLADDRVWDKENYPDFEEYSISSELELGHITLTDKGLNFLEDNNEEKYHNWLVNIGGPNNEFLREFLKNKKLA